TPRLTLIRLTNTAPSSQHLTWYHENWSSPSATCWSLRGASKSLSESRERMMQQLSQTDIFFYAVFATPTCDAEVREREGEVRLGEHLGSVSLRRQEGRGEATLDPLALLSTRASTGSTSTAAKAAGEEVNVDLRVLGYAFFETARGKGYATEANRGLLDAYAAFAVGEKEKASRTRRSFYVEACVDEENAGSKRVLGKLGFRVVGWKEEDERVFLNGAWRVGVYWVWGLFV
ncbi:hypothetical protein T440DRAFT_389960, partial [Plenodomus tracheiphilus IPT5]